MPRRDYAQKKYIDVLTWHKPDGTSQPIRFRVEGEAIAFSVDRIKDVREAASLKAGGQGIRYTCLVRNNEIYLFDDGGFWFVEKEQAEDLINSQYMSV